MTDTERRDEPDRAWDTLKTRMRELDEVNARIARLLQERAAGGKDEPAAK